MNKILLVVTFCITFIASNSNVYAQSAELSDYVYYEIGGASAFNRASGRTTYDVLDISAEASLSLSCGEFDLSANLDQLVDEFSDLGDNVVMIIEAFIANFVDNLPLLILREVNPNLANMVENIIARYEELYRISVANCEEMQRSILEDENPYASWVSFGRRQNMQNNIAEGDTATEANEKRDLVAPVIWIDGVQSGFGVPINVVGDVVEYGYNTLNTGESAISEIWGSTGDAVDYAVRVLGEQTISYDAGNQTVAGAGVLPEVENTNLLVTEQINLLLRNQNATAAELQEASSSYVRLTGSIMDALRQEPLGAQSAYISRLASEISTAREVERLLALRRIFLTARREPHVANTPAWEQINDVIIPEINNEIDMLMQQEQIAKALVSNTGQILLQSRERRKAGANGYLGVPNSDPSLEGFPVE